MKVEVKRSLCISVAACVQTDPETFELDDEGIAVVKGPTSNNKEKISQAAKSCPVNAIIVYDDDGKQIWPEV